MPIFKIDKTKASQITLKEDGFGNEAELRDFFAENLEEILGVRFLEKEYPTTDGRIDILMKITRQSSLNISGKKTRRFSPKDFSALIG